MNSLLKGGILAWRTETSCSVVKNKDLLHMVQMMETEVPRSKLFHLQFTKKKQEERYQAVISAFDEAGRCLDYSSKRSKDKKLWLSKSQSQKLKQQIEKDYLHATGFTSMADAKIYIREVGLVYGGNTLQRVHNDDHTDDFPDGWEQRHSIAAESGTILYGLKDDKDNRCTIHFAEDNEVGRLKKVRVYGGMAVFYAGWVYHAGADHGGRNGSTRMYVDINEMP